MISTEKKPDLNVDIRVQIELELCFEIVGASLQTTGLGQTVTPKVSNQSEQALETSKTCTVGLEDNLQISFGHELSL